MSAGLIGPQTPEQGGLQESFGIESVENGLAGQAELDLAVHLDNGLAGGISHFHLGLVVLLPVALVRLWMRNVAATQNASLDDLLGPIAQIDLEIEGFALAFAEQQPFAERIALVVLLENADGAGLLQVAQHHGIGFQVGAEVGDANFVLAGLEVEGAPLFHYREVLVVDG